jgi:hypothetical protein
MTSAAPVLQPRRTGLQLCNNNNFIMGGKGMECKIILGLCKECFAAIDEDNKIKGYENLFECNKCGYPNSVEDLWDTWNEDDKEVG